MKCPKCGSEAVSAPYELLILAQRAIPYREGKFYWDNNEDRDRFADLAVQFVERFNMENQE